MIDCEQVRDMLDAYALGALEEPDEGAIEEHVADCVRCWEELTKSQQTAAMLALAIPMQGPPAHLESRIMDQADVRRKPRRPTGSRSRVLDHIGIGWPATAGVLAIASVAALAFAAVLQFQLADLRDEKDKLEQEILAEQSTVKDIQEIMTVVATADDVNTTELATVASTAEVGSASYSWSRDQLSGFIICKDLPPLEEGMVYQAWIRVAGSMVNLGTFEPEDGKCHVPITFSRWVSLSGAGISVEPEGGSIEPSEWVMYADFTR